MTLAELVMSLMGSNIPGETKILFEDSQGQLHELQQADIVGATEPVIHLIEAWVPDERSDDPA